MALTGVIKVTTEELEAQAAAVDGEINKMSELFDGLDKRIGKIENYWLGAASEVHCGAYRKQLRQVEELLARYREHVIDLRTMAGVYVAAEQQAASLADELPVSTL